MPNILISLTPLASPAKELSCQIRQLESTTHLQQEEFTGRVKIFSIEKGYQCAVHISTWPTPTPGEGTEVLSSLGKMEIPEPQEPQKTKVYTCKEPAIVPPANPKGQTAILGKIVPHP